VDWRHPALRLRKGVREPSGHDARCAGQWLAGSITCDLSGGRVPAASARNRGCSVIRDFDGQASAASYFDDEPTDLLEA
jgi:hypothetical protein